jgi:hypothetical protein
MNKETYPNIIRNLTKEQLVECLNDEIYLRHMLSKLKLPKQGYLSKLLIKAFNDKNIDISHLPIGRLDDLTGKVFGHLEVIRKGPTGKCGNTTWICREKETGIENPIIVETPDKI